jgi:hypothetical protein
VFRRLSFIEPIDDLGKLGDRVAVISWTKMPSTTEGYELGFDAML